jgi:ATP-dependent DNA helicase RecG
MVRAMSSSENPTPPPAAPAGEVGVPSGLPVSAVWGMGEDRARLLARLDIFTVEDLLLHKPRRYEDRRKFLPIRDLKVQGKKCRKVI